MNWTGLLKQGECRVRLCTARDCIHNKGGLCELDDLTIGHNGMCKQYQVKEA